MSQEFVSISINGEPTAVAPGTTVLAALYNAGLLGCGVSVSGDTRGGLCGMGICFECRVKIGGVPLQRACMIQCEPGMEVSTGG